VRRLATTYSKECSIDSRGENQKDAKRLKLKGESLVRYRVAEEDCYCRGWLQLTEDHEGSSTEKWVELLRDKEKHMTRRS